METLSLCVFQWKSFKHKELFPYVYTLDNQKGVIPPTSSRMSFRFFFYCVAGLDIFFFRLEGFFSHLESAGLDAGCRQDREASQTLVGGITFGRCLRINHSGGGWDRSCIKRNEPLSLPSFRLSRFYTAPSILVENNRSDTQPYIRYRPKSFSLTGEYMGTR